MLKIWQTNNVISFCLLPLSFLYWLIYKVRNYLFIPKKIQKPVICVGNPTVGGAGKTPIAIAIANYFIKKGVKIAFLSHGYKGLLSNVRVTKQHNYVDVGDEAVLLSQIAPTYIGKDRYYCAQLAIHDGAELLIMDDGMQNRSLYQDYRVLVLGNAGNRRLLPAGPMRETLTEAINKSDTVIATHESNKKLTQFYLTPNIVNKKKCFNKNYVMLVAIADPDKFLTTLKKLNITINRQFIFKDHHHYTKQELSDIYNYAKKQSCHVITTSKDFVKIPKQYHKYTEIIEINYKIPQDILLNLEKIVYYCQ